MKKQLNFEETGIVEVHATALSKPSEYSILALASSAFQQDRPMSGLLPRAVRWMSKDGCSFLVERPPGVAQLSIASNSTLMAPKIPMPWVQQFFTFKDKGLMSLGSIYLFARNAPISSEEDELQLLALPETSKGGCLDLPLHLRTNYEYAAKLNAQKSVFDVATALGIVINTLWSSSFHIDELEKDNLPEELREYWPDVRAVTEAWAALPGEQVMGLHYPKSGQSLGDVCELLENERPEKYASTADLITMMARGYV